MSTVAAYGDRAVLIDRIPAHEVPHILCRAEEAFPDFLVRPGLNTILITAPIPTASLLDQVRQWLAIPQSSRAANDARQSPTHILEVTYTGADLARVAAHLNMTEEEVVVAHTATSWRVALIGFAPGFPYLVPVADHHDWSVPRLATPRTQVPAGAVALAAGMSAVYPTVMPGGWNILGTTTTTLFDPGRDRPSLLAPGDFVLFRSKS